MSNKQKWTQRNGEKIRIKDMQDDHLLNAVRMLNRKLSKKNHPLLGELYDEVDRRGLSNNLEGDLEQKAINVKQTIQIKL